MAQTDMLIHSAALAELRAPLEKIRTINVGGTKNVMDFAVSARQKGRLKKVNYISTMYVCGDYRGEFCEEVLGVGQRFHNTYEQTKFEAEMLVRDYRDQGLPCSIFRPSMVMGDSTQGKTNNFRLFYEPLHFFSKGIFSVFPVEPESGINLIHVDMVVRAICALKDEPASSVYHIISPNTINVVELCRIASEYFGFSLPEFVPREQFQESAWTPTQKAMAQPFIPYFHYQGIWASASTEKDLAPYNACPSAISREDLLTVFSYCSRVGFIKVVQKTF
jgi:nucleoside-diphosphate-sugar epimerase